MAILIRWEIRYTLKGHPTALVTHIQSNSRENAKHALMAAHGVSPNRRHGKGVIRVISVSPTSQVDLFVDPPAKESKPWAP